MIKFTKVKGTEIRKVYKLVDEVPVECLAVIGYVKELYSRELIFKDNVAGNEDKVLLIVSNGNIKEFNTIKEAKDYSNRLWG